MSDEVIKPVNKDSLEYRLGLIVMMQAVNGNFPDMVALIALLQPQIYPISILCPDNDKIRNPERDLDKNKNDTPSSSPNPGALGYKMTKTLFDKSIEEEIKALNSRYGLSLTENVLKHYTEHYRMGEISPKTDETEKPIETTSQAIRSLLAKTTETLETTDQAIRPLLKDIDDKTKSKQKTEDDIENLKTDIQNLRTEIQKKKEEGRESLAKHNLSACHKISALGKDFLTANKVIQKENSNTKHKPSSVSNNNTASIESNSKQIEKSEGPLDPMVEKIKSLKSLDNKKLTKKLNSLEVAYHNQLDKSNPHDQPYIKDAMLRTVSNIRKLFIEILFVSTDFEPIIEKIDFKQLLDKEIEFEHHYRDKLNNSSTYDRPYIRHAAVRTINSIHANLIEIILSDIDFNSAVKKLDVKQLLDNNITLATKIKNSLKEPEDLIISQQLNSAITEVKKVYQESVWIGFVHNDSVDSIKKSITKANTVVGKSSNLAEDITSLTLNSQQKLQKIQEYQVEEFVKLATGRCQKVLHQLINVASRIVNTAYKASTAFMTSQLNNKNTFTPKQPTSPSTIMWRNPIGAHRKVAEYFGADKRKIESVDNTTKAALDAISPPTLSK